MKALARIKSAGSMSAWRHEAGGRAAVAIVTGTFDLVHPGNLYALRKARELAETVIVVVEPDEMAAGHAGPGRPQNHVETRVETVAHLRDVSAVTSVERGHEQDFFADLAPFIWVSPEPVRGDGPYDHALAATAGGIVKIPVLSQCFAQDVLQAIASHRTPLVLPAEWSCMTRNRIASVAQAKRVTVNGCFDILHVGHLRFLEAARAMGDSLTVLINSDASVARYKGPTRPVFPEVFREVALRALRQVDDVQVFSNDNPLDEIARLRPDVHVKGGSYEPDRVRQERELVESWGGRLVCTPMVDGFSTTAFIKQVLATKS